MRFQASIQTHNNLGGGRIQGQTKYSMFVAGKHTGMTTKQKRTIREYLSKDKASLASQASVFRSTEYRNRESRLLMTPTVYATRSPLCESHDSGCRPLKTKSRQSSVKSQKRVTMS